MTLDMLQKGQNATITQIDCEKVLKSRLNSLGIKKGETVHIEEITLAKETIEIRVNRTKVALRVSEAKNISIQSC